MKSRILASLKCRVSRPCKKMLQFFRFRFRRPVCVRSLQFRHPKHSIKRAARGGYVPSLLRMLRRKRETDRLRNLASFSEGGHHKAPCPSRVTPAYVRRMGGSTKREAVAGRDDEVEDACRSFEKYLIDTVVEEGEMRDLVDVEEHLCCWKSLSSPVFVDLVCRSYGELCKDLFSSSSENDVST